MGGFTSAPPVFAGKMFGAKTFLHESNAIPGRSNRILSRVVHEAFVGFPEAEARLKVRKCRIRFAKHILEFYLPKRQTETSCERYHGKEETPAQGDSGAIRRVLRPKSSIARGLAGRTLTYGYKSAERAA